MAERRPERVHGGQYGSTERGVLDLSTCVDAFGHFPPVQEALARVNERGSFAAYPDPTAAEARSSIAAMCHVAPGNVDVGPGAAEIIWTLVRTLVHPATRVLMWEPCFSEFAHAAHAASATVISHRSSNPERPIEDRIHAFAEAVRSCAPAVAYVCAPSCPGGEWLPVDHLLAIVRKLEDTVFVIDQSYLNMSYHASERNVRFPRNAVLLRSITKELGTPGVRAGYALMNAELRVALQTQRPHWVLGTHALALLQSYSACQPYVSKRRLQLLAQAQSLSQELSQLNWRPQLCDTPYFTVRPPEQSTLLGPDVAALLLNFHAVAVRDCSSFGLPTHVRVVAHPAQHRLVRAVQELDR